MIKKVTLNSTGVKALLKSDEALQICKDYAYSAQSKLGSGYEVTYMKGRLRANAEVAAVSKAAKLENMKNNTILKAVGSSGD